jgi:hypothetical protein
MKGMPDTSYISLRPGSIATSRTEFEGVRQVCTARAIKADLLTGVKLVIGGRIREPDFAAQIRAEGINLPDLQIAEVVTLDRVIVGSQP